MASPSRKWRKWQSPDSTQGVRPRACTPSLCNPASRKAGKLLAPGGGKHTLSTGPPSYGLVAAGAAQGVVLAALWKDSDMGATKEYKNEREERRLLGQEGHARC